ncbi:MAG: hypothetical protein AABX25_03325, partial [Nanoarchaeota archaeon]
GGGTTSLADLVVNNYPAFGLGDEGVQDKVIGLFNRRINLDDHLNFDIAKGAFHGFMQTEVPGILGIPIEVLRQLDTPDVYALYYGMNSLKGIDHNLGGLPFGKLISKLVHAGYVERGLCAENAIMAIQHKRLGFNVYRSVSTGIADRMDALDENVKLQFLRAFYTMREYSQEHGQNWQFHDPVYGQYHSRRYGAIDSAKSREKYIRLFINDLRKKQEEGNNFDSHNFQGWIAPSFSDPRKIYFVQRNVRHTQGGRKELYDCSCPLGYRRMYNLLVRNPSEECKHITEVRNSAA